MPDLIAILDREHRVVRLNRPMARRLGREPEECVGLRCFEAVHGMPCQPPFCPHAQTLADGKEHTAEVYEERLGGHFLVSTTPLTTPDGRSVRFGPRRPRHHRAQAKGKATPSAQSHPHGAEQKQPGIDACDGRSAYLQEVCNIVTEDCGHAMVWIGFAENDEARRIRPVAHAGFEEGYLETLELSWADCRARPRPDRHGHPQRAGVPVPRHADRSGASCRGAEALRRGYTSSLALPLAADGQGLRRVDHLQPRRADPFSEDEVRLLRELADDLACGISILRLREVACAGGS